MDRPVYKDLAAMRLSCIQPRYFNVKTRYRRIDHCYPHGRPTACNSGSISIEAPEIRYGSSSRQPLPLPLLFFCLPTAAKHCLLPLITFNPASAEQGAGVVGYASGYKDFAPTALFAENQKNAFAFAFAFYCLLPTAAFTLAFASASAFFYCLLATAADNF